MNNIHKKKQFEFQQLIIDDEKESQVNPTYDEGGEEHQQRFLHLSLSYSAPSTFWKHNRWDNETCWYLNAKNNLSNGGQVKCAGSTTVSSSALNGLKLSHLETFKCWSRIYLFNCRHFNFKSSVDGQLLTCTLLPLFHAGQVWSQAKVQDLPDLLVPGTWDWFFLNLSVFWQSELLWKIHMRMIYLTPCLTLSATTRPSNVCLSING